MAISIPVEKIIARAKYSSKTYDDYVRGDKTYFKDNKKLNKKIRSSVRFNEDIKKKYGTIFTPEFVTVKTVDLAWKYVPATKDKLNLTYIDPAAGDGNFLIYVYKKLMKEPSAFDDDKKEKSEHILLNCIHGIEILEEMWNTCKIRLLTEHVNTMKENGGIDVDSVKKVWAGLKIWHGNTILVPEDTWEINHENGEGGLLPEEIRNRKWDVVVGNPPYTALKNIKGQNKYRFKAYKDQQDFATLFVRWAQDHLLQHGVCSYNISDKWLDNKTSNGANIARTVIRDNVAYIIRDKATKEYSMGDGGDIPTLIFCMTNKKHNNDIIIQNDFGETTIKRSRLLENNIITRLEAGVKELPFIGGSLWPGRGLPSWTGRECHTISAMVVQSSTLRPKHFFDINGQPWTNLVLGDIGNYIFAQLLFSSERQFKIAANKNQKINKDTGEINVYTFKSKEEATWTFAYLNTNVGFNEAKLNSTPNGQGGCKIYWNVFQYCRVPDFEYYNTYYPDRVKAYLMWVEQNMHNKDVFLAGIDREFVRLVKE